MKKQPYSGFGLAPMKVEGEIADPDEFNWEHNPHSGECGACTRRYRNWRAAYAAQEAKKEAVRADKNA